MQVRFTIRDAKILNDLKGHFEKFIALMGKISVYIVYEKDLV